MRYFFAAFAGTAFILSASAGAQTPPPPEEVLAEASRYTVKIQVQNEIALNQDDPGSLSGTGFLIDRKRGWLLTNAHVATRSPATIKVQFKDGKQLIAACPSADNLRLLAI